MTGISVFWDNSNIWLVGRNVCKAREPGDENAFRIHFQRLFEHCVNGRPVDYAFAGGSLPPQNDELWLRLKNLKIEVETQERGEFSGKEVAVDQSIQFAISNRLLDETSPATIVLMTGDGAGYNDGKGFIKALERARKHGWNIEVVSWDMGCNSKLKQFAINNGVYRSLETHYEKITFIQNKRWATG